MVTMAHRCASGPAEPLGALAGAYPDLEQVATLARLHYLGLKSEGVTDAGLSHLKRLKSLQELTIGSTKVTKDGLKKLERELPDCKISPFVY